jgi:AcrR family transcriptional regulator
MAQATSARRLGPEARREQLVQAGVALIRDVPFDQLGADDVAQACGVSKGLVFHYFPTTRDLQVAVLRATTEDLLAGLDVDPTATPAERLRLGVDAYVAYIERAPASYLAIARSAGSDARLGAVFEETRNRVVELIRGVLGAGSLPPGLAIGLRGWIALVEESALHWVAIGRPIDRCELVTFLLDVALAMLPEAMVLPERRHPPG